MRFKVSGEIEHNICIYCIQIREIRKMKTTRKIFMYPKLFSFSFFCLHQERAQSQKCESRGFISTQKIKYTYKKDLKVVNLKKKKNIMIIH